MNERKRQYFIKKHYSNFKCIVFMVKVAVIIDFCSK